jgi:hypothetical protein
MKPLVTAIALAVLAFSAFAEGAEPQKQNVPSTTLTPAGPPRGEDSALVRAAKSSGRLNKKPSMVITNDTLVRAGGHITSTTVTTPVPTLPAQPVVDEQWKAMAARAAREAAEKAKREEAAKKEQLQRTADYSGESIEQRIDDPAMQERMMQQPEPAKKPPTN